MATPALISSKDYALYYRNELGLSVFVLNIEPATHRKRPLFSWEAFKTRYATNEEFETWFDVNPNYNLAIVTGAISKAIGFDVDGPTAVKRIEEKIPKMSSNLQEALANTMKTITGSGGEHIILRIEEPIDDISQEILWKNGEAHSQILMQGNNHYLVAAPSIHPNNNRYKWNGKKPQTITRQELNEFIRLVSSHDQQRQNRAWKDVIQEHKDDTSITRRSLNHDQMDKLLSWIKPYYIPGDRDYIIFYLSGMMRKADFSLETTRTFIKILCTESEYSDEDIDKSLTTVDRTYRQPLNELNGKSGLHELLVTSHSINNINEHHARAEAFSQICQIINGPPPAPSLPSPSDTTLTTNSENNTLSGVKDEGKMLIIEKAEYDDNSKIITYLTRQVVQSVTLRTLFDSREILYYDKGEKFYRPGGDRIIDIEVERIIKEIGALFASR